MRIAIVGSGISGLVVAHHLHREHDVALLEASDRIGGHTHTHTIEHAGSRYEIDTGFIVFNERTYPRFMALLRELGVAWQPSDMGFSVRDERTGLEWSGRNLDTLYAQRRNLLRPSFHGMLVDIVRFGREARALLDESQPELELGTWLDSRSYGRAFVDHYLVPMAAAIWSASPGELRTFPARFLARFFHNHGFLDLQARPQWLVVEGGSRRYVEALVRPFARRIRLRARVQRVHRDDERVELELGDGARERFDAVVIAAHSDQALAMLADPTRAEREVLGAIRYQENEAVLHTDSSLLPRTIKCRASWNYHVAGEREPRAALTYWMNRLQSLHAPVDFCVTLNRSDAIDPARVLKRVAYHHPRFTLAAVAAQRRWSEINGQRRTWFAGAYWGYGFHEDGVRSALRVVESLSRAGRAVGVSS